MAQKAKRFADIHLGTYEKIYLDELYDFEIYTAKEMERFFAELKDQTV